MTTDEIQPAAEQTPAPATPEQESSSQHRSKGIQNRRGPRPFDGGEERRRRKPGSNERRGMNGYGDAIERSYCLSYKHAIPPAFPVQSRTGVATMPTTIVGRRENALLLCDGSHEGHHEWPDGEIAADN